MMKLQQHRPVLAVFFAFVLFCTIGLIHEASKEPVNAPWAEQFSNEFGEMLDGAIDHFEAEEATDKFGK